jgi:alpha-amylase
MKRIYSFLVALFALAAMPLGAFAQGWPANYGGVMLQGFYLGQSSR